MSSLTPRSRVSPVKVTQPALRETAHPNVSVGNAAVQNLGNSTSTLWESEGHPVNRKTGHRMGGGPFRVTHSGVFANPGHVSGIMRNNVLHNRLYSGPVIAQFQPVTEYNERMGKAPDGKYDKSVIDADGATAIAQCSPTNPTANLGTSLAETFREGFPSLPGIQSWESRVSALRKLGSEYLNYQFGWAPLKSEIHSTVHAARFHRDIMQNYAHNEGRNIHRSFSFPDEITRLESSVSNQDPITGILDTTWLLTSVPASESVTVFETTRKRWFEGCFTYGGPSKVDSFDRHLGFGREADAVFGLDLTPEVLWEVTPWSWAVDWFTNAQDVIHNVSSFASAGLVMRYGYMMEETIKSHHTEWGDGRFCRNSGSPTNPKVSLSREGRGSRGELHITRTRVPANPFGFGVSWEGLSPTQLAITAAIGITRLL